MLELLAGKSPSTATEGNSSVKKSLLLSSLLQGFSLLLKIFSPLEKYFFCRRVKHGERPPDSFLLGSCADTQALADERPAGMLFVCEAVFAREHLVLGMQGCFLCFWGMFDICLLLCHSSPF